MISCVSWSVCMSVHAVEGKRLQLSTPKSVEIRSMSRPRHAITSRSNGQRLIRYRVNVRMAAGVDLGLPVDMTALISVVTRTFNTEGRSFVISQHQWVRTCRVQIGNI